MAPSLAESGCAISTGAPVVFNAAESELSNADALVIVRTFSASVYPWVRPSPSQCSLPASTRQESDKNPNTKAKTIPVTEIRQEGTERTRNTGPAKNAPPVSHPAGVPRRIGCIRIPNYPPILSLLREKTPARHRTAAAARWRSAGRGRYAPLCLPLGASEGMAWTRQRP